MKKIAGVVFSFALIAGLALYIPCAAAGDMSAQQSQQDTGGSTGGAAPSGESVQKSTGGATGAAAGEEVDALKKSYNNRIKTVDKEISSAKKSADSLAGNEKNMAQMKIDEVQAKRDSVKKMISDLKRPGDAPVVETALADLEKSSQGLSSSVQRSTSGGGSSGGSTGGSSSVETSTGGATGGAAGVDQIKKDLNDRIDMASKELDGVKKQIKGSTGTKKDTLQLELDKVEGKQAAAKKMVSGMKDPAEKAQVEPAVADFEQSVQQLKSQAGRSSPAGGSGETKSQQSGGSTGGAAGSAKSDAGASAQSGMDEGGATGGAAGKGTMQFSYDQRSQFKKTVDTKLDSMNKRIEMLKENAKIAPQDVNNSVTPKVESLSKQSSDIKSKIDKIESSERQKWNTTRSEINNNLDSLENSLMQAEKSIS